MTVVVVIVSVFVFFLFFCFCSFSSSVYIGPIIIIMCGMCDDRVIIYVNHL